MNVLTNAGNSTIQVQVAAEAHNAWWPARASAGAFDFNGVDQIAVGGFNNLNTLTNAGKINVMANAIALATGTAFAGRPRSSSASARWRSATA